MDNVLRTIVYFDIFDWPLRAEEIYKWLFLPEKNLSLNEILRLLKENAAFEKRDGFFFLKNRENIVGQRIERFRLAERKFKKIKKIAKIFSFFPFIKMIAVCNNLGYSNAPDGSDIDIFVVVSPGKIWTTRFFITGFLKIFRLRPGERSIDAICPSFFIGEDSLNLENLALKNQNNETDDPHFIYWASQMVPVFDREETYKKFCEANAWLKKFLPNVSGCEIPARRKISSFHNGPAEKIFRGKLGVRFEEWAKKTQIRIMPEQLKLAANKNTNVIITDDLLKFHLNDTRESVRKKLNGTVAEYAPKSN